jgi:putative ABC transport system substrate-binding protein
LALRRPFWPLRASGQQLAGSFRIGYLGHGSTSNLRSAFDAFRDELRQLGYVERRNLTIEYRWAELQASETPNF